MIQKLFLFSFVLGASMSTPFDRIRAAMAAIDDQQAILAAEFTALENGYEPIPEPPQSPIVPTPTDCLAGPTPTPTGMISGEQNETAWIQARATFRTTMKNALSGSILFIGDSQIAGFDTSLVTPYGVNLGISGESSRQLLYRLNENDSNNAPNFIHRAGAVVIETFVNDLGDATTYGTAQNALDTIIPFMLPRLAQWVSGKVVIICPTKVDSSKGFWTSNAAIETLNTKIKQTFANRADVAVIDINPIIAPNGSLLPQYYETNGPGTGDGHHLGPAGKAVKAEKIKEKLIALGINPLSLTP